MQQRNINKQIKQINNSTQEKDKRYKKPAEEKQLQETKTCYTCGSKKHLIKSFKITATYFSQMNNGQRYQKKSWNIS